MIHIDFYCSHCGYHELWEIRARLKSDRHERPPDVLCPECHEPLVLDVEGEVEEESDADITD